MNINDLRIGMRVKHPAYGDGTVVTILERTSDILFDDGARRTVSPDTSAIGPAEAMIAIEGLSMPLAKMIQQTVRAVVDTLELEQPASVVQGLGLRWRNGTLVMKPEDASLQSKEIPIETFFHKIVMVRNQLRVLEQKINAHEGLSDAEKVEFQQYITRSYGSMTTFNVLFKDKDDGF